MLCEDEVRPDSFISVCVIDLAVLIGIVCRQCIAVLQAVTFIFAVRLQLQAAIGDEQASGHKALLLDAVLVALAQFALREPAKPAHQPDTVRAEKEYGRFGPLAGTARVIQPIDAAFLSKVFQPFGTTPIVLMA